MIGASRGSLATARENLETLTDSAAVDPVVLAQELAAVTALLDREVPLRRVLTDPARSGEDKASFVASLLGGKVGRPTVDTVAGMVRTRWSSPRDFVDAVEYLAALSELVAADRAGQLDDVEDEVFRFGRVVAGSHELRAALTEPKASAEAKSALVAKLLDGRASASTVRLVTELVVHPRGRSLEQGLETVSRLAAARRDRVVALVTTAVPLSDRQKERLGAALAKLHGHRVHLNIDVDPSVLGGVRVQIGDEVVEGTVASRLDGARQGLGG